MTYIKRVIDAELKERLSSAGAVVLEGPKACGKTETAMQIAASSVFLDLDSAARTSIDIDPRLPVKWRDAPAHRRMATGASDLERCSPRGRCT